MTNMFLLMQKRMDFMKEDLEGVVVADTNVEAVAVDVTETILDVGVVDYIVMHMEIVPILVADMRRQDKIIKLTHILRTR